MSFSVMGGALIVAWGVVEVVWALVADLPRSQIAQGLFFIELGLAFLAMALLQPGVMRSSVAGALGVSAFISAVMQYRLVRAESQRG